MTPTISFRSALGALLLATTVATTAHADGRDYKDGPVVNVSSVRTVDGHFDDYMHWLATTWKQQEEAAKKAGLINSYEVLVVEPRGPQDPDIYLVVEYKNWAALDGLGGKLDSISAQVEGSVDKANQSESARAKIRTVIGSQTMQRADLK
ncbi:MAG TPA: hypothetical protein VH209_06160 [Steroidobacteraceae bacterium]|jgi:hypothetical protein|nr:hypothetical protein [Steroidobacteraceae bacterium]